MWQPRWQWGRGEQEEEEEEWGRPGGALGPCSEQHSCSGNLSLFNRKCLCEVVSSPSLEACKFLQPTRLVPGAPRGSL